jgi:acylpyruvate hydrolase
LSKGTYIPHPPNFLLYFLFHLLFNFTNLCPQIICIGRNYADHITELKNTAPKQPFFFLKPPTTLLPPKSGPVLLPRGVKTHYEVELGLVMGKTVRDFDEKASGEKGAIGAIESMYFSNFLAP